MHAETHFVVYMLRCVDGSFYVGQTDQLEIRLVQHHDGAFPACYTFEKRPVELVWFEEFVSRDEALNRERQIKGWSRKKKIALMDQDWARVSAWSKGREMLGRPSTAPLRGSAQGEREEGS
jgi:putative endonuclease